MFNIDVSQDLLFLNKNCLTAFNSKNGMKPKKPGSLPQYLWLIYCSSNWLNHCVISNHNGHCSAVQGSTLFPAPGRLHAHKRIYSPGFTVYTPGLHMHNALGLLVCNQSIQDNQYVICSNVPAIMGYFSPFISVYIVFQRASLC